MRNIDWVLDQLLVEGIFDREEPNMRSAVEEMCQEIGLVAFMFFFELFFFYVSSSISFYVPFTNLFSIIHSPYLLITRDTQEEGEARFRFY